MPEFNNLFKNSYEITRSIWEHYQTYIHTYNYSCMSSMNSYTYMYNHKVLNEQSNETRMNNCNCRNKDTCPLPNTFKRNALFIKPTLSVALLDTNKNVTLDHVKQHLKIISEIIKSRSTTLNIKMMQNYQKNMGKSRSSMKHQKLHGKLALPFILKWKIQNCNMQKRQPFKQKNWDNKHLQKTEGSTNLTAVKLWTDVKFTK